MLTIVDPDTLDLSAYIRVGDRITWGQGTGEPLRLIESLVEQRAAIGHVEVFLGISLVDTFQSEHFDHIHLISYGAVGTNAKFVRTGEMDVLPCHFSAVPNLIGAGHFPIDVVFVQISPPGPDGTHSFGFCNDYLPIAMSKARVVIAEINMNVPWVYQDVPFDEELGTLAIESDDPVASYKPLRPGAVETQIARNIAGRIEDGATIQYGIGGIPPAVFEALEGHRDLGLHSGLVSDEAIALIQAGVITNARKPIHKGKSIGALAFGGEKFKNFAHVNPHFEMHQSTSTHGAATLSQITNLVSINSALEVDLFGQVNAEQIGTKYLGAIGGQIDFMHAASTHQGGLSIIAMPASLGKSGRGRITDKLAGPLVTTARADVDLVITEFGIADLRGKTLDGRAHALIGVALPEHRDRLLASWKGLAV